MYFYICSKAKEIISLALWRAYILLFREAASSEITFEVIFHLGSNSMKQRVIKGESKTRNRINRIIVVYFLNNNKH